MKVIILAGGRGTRISEETRDKPKPMVLVFNRPILWHIMSIYAKQGFKEFLIATGYRGEVIANWLSEISSPWKITAIDTGIETQTGGRIKKCMELFPNEDFLCTYGDGVGNINVRKLIAFHELHGKLATLTAVHPPARFGYLELHNGAVVNFGEKNQSQAGWINGGFFVVNSNVANFIEDYSEPFETGALPRLTKSGELMAFQHHGFWQPIDTLREKNDLELLAQEEEPPWLQNL